MKRKPAYLHNTAATFALNLDQVLETFKDHRRLGVFFHKGRSCVNCGRTGDRLVLWYDWHWKHLDFCPPSKGLHIDLLAGDILMTVDHIKPKSLGGPDSLANLQPMCSPCNNKKGAKWDGDSSHLAEEEAPKGNCCCSRGAAVGEEWAEFQCADCVIHTEDIMAGGHRCKRHRKALVR